MKNLNIKTEFRDLIQPLTSEERKKLEENILKDKVITDPIITWNDYIIDGHNRYEIAVQHDMEFNIIEKQFEDENDVMIWIIDKQFGRRNLNDAQRINLGILQKDFYSKKAKNNKRFFDNEFATKNALGKFAQVDFEEPKSIGVEINVVGGHMDPEQAKELGINRKPFHTRNYIAEKAGVSPRQVSNFEKLKREAPKELLNEVLSGEKTINKGLNELYNDTINQENLIKVEQSIRDEQKFAKQIADLGYQRKNDRSFDFKDIGEQIASIIGKYTEEQIKEFYEGLKIGKQKQEVYNRKSIVDSKKEEGFNL